MIHVRGGSAQIPDGVAYNDGNCWVIDASVVADKADLNDAHLSKCAKYDTPAVRDWCQANWPSPGPSGAVRFGALVLKLAGSDVPAVRPHVSAVRCY